MIKISGNIVDALRKTTYAGTLVIDRGVIVDILPENRAFGQYIVPPFIDAHVHIESAMLVPSQFARQAVRHGTVACVSDPHEIANVLGMDGIDFMIGNAATVPFKFFFGAPSCVPATSFETSGQTLDAENIETLLKRKEIPCLSEVMNFPGVLHEDPDVMRKIALAKKYRKPIDGHAPGLRGPALEKYAKSGVSTDHETFEMEEALEKLALGMKIMIREGSAAKNFDTLIDILAGYPDYCMLCSDDKHPDDLVRGHINDLVRRALEAGYDPMAVFRASSVNPVRHYGLPVGLLQKGDPADFVVTDGLTSLNILETWIDGTKVADRDRARISPSPATPINRFDAGEKKIDDFEVRFSGGNLKVMLAYDGRLDTGRAEMAPKVSGDRVVSDVERDILKIAVVNRYADRPPALGFIRNFGLKRGAIASSVAHDSHNVIVVGTTDEEIASAVNAVIRDKGGLCAVSGRDETILPLPVAGLMSGEDGRTVAEAYDTVDRKAKALGCPLHAPFMTLSFMALPVIPSLKMTDRGLFDVDAFSPTSLFSP